MRIATEEYLLWFIPAMALQFAMVSMGAALRGTGNFKPGMLCRRGTVIINMVLAPFLIFGWGPFPHGRQRRRGRDVRRGRRRRGVDLVYFIDSKAYLRFHFAPLEAAARRVVGVLKIGLPAGAEFALMGSTWPWSTRSASRSARRRRAGSGSACALCSRCSCPSWRLGFAVAPVAGQNFAARKGDRVRAAFKTAAMAAA